MNKEQKPFHVEFEVRDGVYCVVSHYYGGVIKIDPVPEFEGLPFSCNKKEEQRQAHLKKIKNK